MAALQQFSVVKELTECSICTEEFTDPRVLPCHHTFCLDCLMNYARDRRPGDRMPCPLCRQEFTIPASGLAAIQKSFIMEKLLSASRPSAGEELRHGERRSIPCDVCSSEATSSAPQAMNCLVNRSQQNYLDHCTQNHTKTALMNRLGGTERAWNQHGSWQVDCHRWAWQSETVVRSWVDQTEASQTTGDDETGRGAAEKCQANRQDMAEQWNSLRCDEISQQFTQQSWATDEVWRLLHVINSSERRQPCWNCHWRRFV